VSTRTTTFTKLAAPTTRSVASPPVDQVVAALPASADLAETYGLWRRAAWTLTALLFGVLVAGFWNAAAVDGFGRNVVAGTTIGDTQELAGTFANNGFGFGAVFAWVAGLAATFTACNCVVYAMLPGLACTAEGAADAAASRRAAWRALGAFASMVLLVGAAYGMFIGFLGSDGVRSFNERPVRLALAQAVFTSIGLVMLVWGAIAFGYLGALTRRLSPVTRSFFSMAGTKAALMGLLVGSFAIGRPFPVFHEFLTYAAAAHSPLYGALVMALHGLGEIALMVLLFSVLVFAFGRRLTRWASRKPWQPALLTAVALTAGGAYFVYYWGVAIAFDLGRWGFRLGWYG